MSRKLYHIQVAQSKGIKKGSDPPLNLPLFCVIKSNNDDTDLYIAHGAGASGAHYRTGADGVSMAGGGGNLLLQGDRDWYGVGHNAVYDFDGTTYLVFHGYDASDNGRSKLRIGKLVWNNGWPEVAGGPD